MAVLRVRDNGIGIAPDMLPRIFELFVQADHARRQAQGGLGIGLTLVKNLVEMHDGTVEARSEGLGRGASSSSGCRWPRTPSPAPSTLRRERRLVDGRRAVPHAGAAPALLVVDDNVDTAESLRRALTLRRHDVNVVYDGLDALEAAGRLDPDVVLLDINLPKLDGLTVARALRARGAPFDKRPLLVATSGLGRQVDRERTKEAGFDHHLVKPVDLDSLESWLAHQPS